MNYLPITIVTPCLNEAKFLSHTIESVLGQNYPALQYWVVDGGSTDETLDILSGYDGRVQWISEPDEGQSDAINKGFKRASEEGIVAWLNANDAFLPDALHAVNHYFSLHPEAGLVFGRSKVMSESGVEVEDYHIYNVEEMKRLNSLPHGHFQVLLNEDSGWISQPAAFWKASLTKEWGGLRTDLHYAMDYEYWLRCGSHMPIHFVDAPLGAFRLHAHAKSTFARKMWSEVLKVNKEYGGRFLSPLHRKFLLAGIGAVKKRVFPR